MPDQFPDRGYFYRSDQFNFAKIGVPAIYFDRGTDYIGKPAGWGKQWKEEWEEHIYHQPSDQIDDTWVFDGMIEDAQIGFYSAWLIAQADAMPTWNKGDEFEATRAQEACSRWSSLEHGRPLYGCLDETMLSSRNRPPPQCTSCEMQAAAVTRFRRNQVCDHVLMAAAVRMVHRMIDIQKDEDQKPH